MKLTCTDVLFTKCTYKLTYLLQFQQPQNCYTYQLLKSGQISMLAWSQLTTLSQKNNSISLATPAVCLLAADAHQSICCYCCCCCSGGNCQPALR